jgi:hypothetical protein
VGKGGEMREGEELTLLNQLVREDSERESEWKAISACESACLASGTKRGEGEGGSKKEIEGIKRGRRSKKEREVTIYCKVQVL